MQHVQYFMSDHVITKWLEKTQEREGQLLEKARIDSVQSPVLAWNGRTFLPVNQLSQNPNVKSRVRIMTYNISSDCKFSGINCDYTTANDSQMRWTSILREIRCCDPDVIAIQDMDLFKQFWQPQLMMMGYDTCFKKRTEVRGRHEEGVAIAYKRDLFQLFKTDDVNLNDVAEHKKASISVDLRDRCINDDVALIACLQPWPRQYLQSAICFAAAMFSDRNDSPLDREVRVLQAAYLATRIEKANSEFQLPVVLGITLNDEPSSPAYHILRTGRVQLRQEAPRKCQPPRVVATSRGSVKVYWLAPYRTIADPGITSYLISWCPGGSTALNFRTMKEITSGNCIQYVFKYDASGVRRTVPLVTSFYYRSSSKSNAINYRIYHCYFY